MDIYEQVREKALPIIKAYHDDLLVHDKRDMERNQGVPFLHFTGNTGTFAFFMIPAEDYPAKGEIVPYLFGKVDRVHILQQYPKTVECMKRVNRQDLILYFNGKRLIEIKQKRAESIARRYEDKIWRDWRKAEREKHERS
jgi:hypothetical protein